MMTEINSMADVFANSPLCNNECLTGHVLRPYIKNGELVGAVLAFDGRASTALLHIRQMTGEDAAARLQNMGIGDPIRVKVILSMEGNRRKIWATEKGVETSSVVETFAKQRESFVGLEGRVHGVADFGIFVELLTGPACGKKGLVRMAALNARRGRATLGSLVQYKEGDAVHVDLADARVDERTGKLLLQLENLRPRLGH